MKLEQLQHSFDPQLGCSLGPKYQHEPFSIPRCAPAQGTVEGPRHALLFLQLVWLVSFLAAFFLSLPYGVAVGVGFSVLVVVFHTQL